MIPLADGWERVARTLRKGPVSFALKPVKMVTSMGTAYTKDVAEPDANGYEVALLLGTDDRASEHSLATFADARDAWEFAAIATHYVEARSPEALVPGSSRSPVDGKPPSGVVDEQSPRSVFAELVGYDTEPFDDMYE